MDNNMLDAILVQEEESQKMQMSADEKVKQNIEKEDKKSRGKYIGIMFASFGIGAAAGIVMVIIGALILKSNVPFIELFAAIQIKSAMFFKFAMIVSDIVLFIISVCFFNKAKKLWKKVEQREDNWETVEDLVSKSIQTLNILTILNLLLFGLGNYMIRETMNPISLYLITLVIFLFFLFGSFSIQKKGINFLKEMNPEKRGSLYDMKFQSKWYESCGYSV